MKKVLFALSFMVMVGLHVFAQTTNVTGMVTDSKDGSPIPGVSVFVKGTTIGTVTMPDGNYNLAVPNDASTIVYSFVGMTSQEIPFTGQTKIDVVLKSDSEDIDEVVVVAYGTTTKEAFTGSAGTVKAAQLSKRQVTNATQSLTGQVAGVQIVNTSGQPGASPTVRIRGIGSMSAGNTPLYVVDGVPYDGNVSAINPNDIESMTVLKDAAASAIYGARGANGVILITTKKGKGDEATVTVDAKWGNNRRAIPNYEVMDDPAMYYETFYRAMYNSKAHAGASASEAHMFANENMLNKDNGGLGYQVYTVPDGEYFIGTNGKLNPNATLGYSDGDYYYTPDDWYDEMFNSSNLRQEYNVSVRGRSDKMTYYLSAGYLDDTGIAPSSGYTRYTTRLNADYQAKEWLKVGANLAYTNYDYKAPGSQTSWGSSGNLFYVANMMSPIYPIYVRNPDGSIKVDNNGITVYDFGTSTNQQRAFMGLANPGITMNLNKYNRKNDVFNGKWFANVDIFEGLRFTTNFGVNSTNIRRNDLYNAFYGSAAADDGQVYVEHYRQISLNQQYLLNYKRDFGAHSFDVLAGYESYDLTMQEMSIDSKNLYNPNVAEIGNAIYSPATVDSYTNKYATEGIIGRVQYDYDGRIFASASFRRDASSRFHPDKRWGNFGSVGAAWIISKEDFFTGLGASWVNQLKLKASFGQQGNDDLQFGGVSNYYPYIDQYQVDQVEGKYAPVFYYKGNKDITWETSHSLNGGVEFKLFSNRLTGSAEYFRRKTSDMLYYQPVPVSLGYSSKPVNVGSMLNKGFEMDLNYQIIRNSNFTWSVNLNATTFKNEILSLEESVAETGIKRSITIWEVGGSLYDSFLREYAGVDPNSGKALYYMADGDGNYVLDDNGNKTTTDDWNATKQVNLGTTLPDVYGGFGTQIDVHGFDISAMFSYQLGGELYDGSYMELMHSGDNAGLNWHKDILNAWTEDNRNTNVPRINTLDDSYQKLSSRFLQSSDYLALNNLTIGYTLPQRWVDYMKMGSVRMYVAGDNLFILTSRKGIDPRQTFGANSWTGSGAHRYSSMMTISGGVTITF